MLFLKVHCISNRFISIKLHFTPTRWDLRPFFSTKLLCLKWKPLKRTFPECYYQYGYLETHLTNGKYLNRLLCPKWAKLSINFNSPKTCFWSLLGSILVQNIPTSYWYLVQYTLFWVKIDELVTKHHHFSLSFRLKVPIWGFISYVHFPSFHRLKKW